MTVVTHYYLKDRNKTACGIIAAPFRFGHGVFSDESDNEAITAKGWMINITYDKKKVNCRKCRNVIKITK